MLFLMSLVGCASQQQHGSKYLCKQQDAEIHIDGSTLFFNGDLSEDSVLCAINMAQGHDIKTLNVRSEGGVIDDAMYFAHWIRDGQINVEINELCFSSCANYIFPAGVIKYISERDLIGWHGGAFQKNIEFRDYAEKQQFQLYIRKARKKEVSLYSRLGIDPRLPTIGQEDEYFCQNNGELGWFYSVEDLTSLGITNIVLTDNKWEPLNFHAEMVCQVSL